ncbi:hypothetical protein GpartN1_g7364.t1 [Galdieria partita]|uniref:Sec-independent protein translocase protein TatA n=1 Tax=Galdieria partita TaxID=83374 RepID=A0A9C7Q333_9RHOD|nr:hypothetical protein GpartN1_g7364.t1 [Galdieria partita]
MLGFVICSCSPIVSRRPFLGKSVKSLCGKRSCKKCYQTLKSYHPLVAVFDGGGGIFGVGTSELVVIGLVAWIVLGPKRLYALSKDLGRIFGELRQSAEEARNTLVAALESELEEPSRKETMKPKTGDDRQSVDTSLQDESQWEQSRPQQKLDGIASKQQVVDKDRKLFLEQMEQLKSSNPQPPEELPDILKKIPISKEEVREHSVHSSYENEEVDSELSSLDKKYQEWRNENIERKELKE